VQFYTKLDGVDADDTTKVGSLEFVKPVEIHPVQYTTDLEVAMLQMKHCYCDSINEDGVCVQPFIVYCASRHYAMYVVHFLQELSAVVKGDPSRIH
jgi:hypothetical protein